MYLNFCVVQLVGPEMKLLVSSVGEIYRWNEKTCKYDVSCTGEMLESVVSNTTHNQETLRMRQCKDGRNYYHHVRVIKVTSKQNNCTEQEYVSRE